MAVGMLVFYHFSTKKTLFGFVTQLFARVKSQIQVKLSVLKTLYLFFLGWHKGMPVPDDIYTLYVVQAGYYIHAIYAVLFMDLWRKDSILTFSHHILTISLIVLSFSLR